MSSAAVVRKGGNARALKDRGVPVAKIAKKLTIKIGKNAGKSPSVASLYRALAEADDNDGGQAEARLIGPRRPVRARITGLGSGTDPELKERLQQQVLGEPYDEAPTKDGAADDVVKLLAEHGRGHGGIE